MPLRKCVLWIRIHSLDLGIGSKLLTRPRSVSLIQVRRLALSILGRFVFMRLQYASTIDNFDELINSRMLARHFLGPKPSPYVLCAIAREEKSKCLSFSTLVLLLPTLLLTFCLWWSFAGMTAKFNQKLYAKLRAKKNEPLSSLAQKQP